MKLRRFATLAPTLAAAGLLAAGCSPDTSEPTAPEPRSPDGEVARGGFLDDRVVVANRGSGTISVIDARSTEVSGTFDLPRDGDEPIPEPMYVVHTRRHGRVFVGDRANDRVVAFDDRSYEVLGTAPAGDGVFHMWADRLGRQLWVNNDVDNTTSVIDPRHLTEIATVPMPADLVAMGGKPHDVIVAPLGHLAYVSIIGVEGENDYVVQYDTHTFTERGRTAVGKDPHLSLALQHNRLYVPCQNSDVVIVLNRFTLEEITTLEVPGAHGAGMTRNGRFFYTANLPGGGDDALFTIDTRRNRVIGDPTDSPFPVPHNIALDPRGRKLFLTHSGASADKVSVYRTSLFRHVPILVGEVTVGLNPFGLTYVR